MEEDGAVWHRAGGAAAEQKDDDEEDVVVVVDVVVIVVDEEVMTAYGASGTATGMGDVRRCRLDVPS